MSQDWFDDVKSFMQKVKQDTPSVPTVPDEDTQRLRRALLWEEFCELQGAGMDGHLPLVADGLVDLIYVAIGMAVAYGMDLRPIWDAVHAANMLKFGVAPREDGKILKPSNWEHPDVGQLLKDQGWKG